jgi:hypothetical protein
MPMQNTTSDLACTPRIQGSQEMQLDAGDASPQHMLQEMHGRNTSSYKIPIMPMQNTTSDLACTRRIQGSHFFEGPQQQGMPFF